MKTKRVLTNPGLSRGLIVAVLAALLPLAVLSILQGLSTREYANDLLRERLVASAAASAAAQRESFGTARRLLDYYQRDTDVLRLTPDCSAALARYRNGPGGPITMLIRRDAAGHAVCSSGPLSQRLQTYRPPGWWEAARTGRFTVGSPFVIEPGGARVISTILPLKDERGQFAGTINAWIDVSWLERSLRETRLSSDAVALLVDHDGKPLVQSANGPAEQFAIAPALGKTAQLSGEHNWIYSASPLVEGQLFLVYAEPELPVFAATRNQLYLSMAVPLLAVVLGCLALWIGVRRLVLRWLRELTGVAEALRQGTYPDHRERFDKAPRELAQLSDDLHDMAGAIELRDRSLTEAADRNLALAREVNHRVKNNLQIVISLISLQKANVSDPAAQSALEQTGTRIAGIGLIHQLLYDESPGELGQVEIVKLIGGLCRLLTGESDEDRIALECEGGEGSLPIDQAVPLTLFIIEAVCNAYRHGYPGKRTGIIAVELSRDESRGFLCVTDDGVGYDRTSAGMATGLALMQAYVVQLRGELALETGPTQGVKLDLRFPIAEEAI